MFENKQINTSRIALRRYRGGKDRIQTKWEHILLYKHIQKTGLHNTYRVAQASNTNGPTGGKGRDVFGGTRKHGGRC